MSRHVSGAPRISVITPCYNHGQYLGEAVDSVLAQTFQDFEIVVVDDGSTDAATQAVFGEFQRPKTRVIHAPHGGLAAARNLGIAHASGEYLCALDADDRLEPSYFAKAVRVLDEDPSATFVSAWLRTFGEEEWLWQPERCDLPTLLWEDTVLTGALVRRAAVLEVGGYDTAMPEQGDEDWDLWLTLVERGHSGVILPEVLFNYRRRAGSMSTVCWNGPGHVPLARYRVAKHHDTYRAHLLDVLLHQDAETAAELRRNDEIERYLASELEPAVASRREELATLRARLAAAIPDAAIPAPDIPAPTIATPAGEVTSAHLTKVNRDLEAALVATSAEVAALHASISWRLTRPLRRIYDVWLRWQGTE